MYILQIGFDPNAGGKRCPDISYKTQDGKQVTLGKAAFKTSSEMRYIDSYLQPETINDSLTDPLWGPPQPMVMM